MKIWFSQDAASAPDGWSFIPYAETVLQKLRENPGAITEIHLDLSESSAPSSSFLMKGMESMGRKVKTF